MTETLVSGKGPYERRGYRSMGDGFVPKQFQSRLRSEVPWKSVAFAVFLFLLGSLAISLGVWIHAGYAQDAYRDRTLPLFILGILTFIPGSYHVYIAIRVLIGSPGFSFDNYAKID